MEGDNMGVLYLDFTKVFDSVSHYSFTQSNRAAELID